MLSVVWLVQSLASRDQDVIVKVLRNPVKCSLKKEGIHAVAKLLKDPRGKVSASASSVLRILASQPRPREQVREPSTKYTLCTLNIEYVYVSGQ